MTENEKAATFIGWELTHCAGYKPCGFVMPDGHAHNRPLRPKGLAYIDHEIPAPDMRDPRNYIRALEAISLRYPWRLAFHIDEDGYRLQTFMPDGQGNGTFKLHDIAGTIGGAVTKALAALYDSEHKGSQS